MALSKDILYKDIHISGAYLTVMRPNISDDKSLLEFGVWYYTSKDSPLLDAVSYTMPYDIESPSFHQAYLYLKTLAEFQDAVDC